MESRRKFIEEMKELLLQRKREVLEETNELETEKPERDDVMDYGDAVQQMNMERLNDSLENVEFSELNEIELALEKIEKGTYGICESCGKEISEARLRAYPYARLCIKCKEAEEEEKSRVV